MLEQREFELNYDHLDQRHGPVGATVGGIRGT